jgi:hypothetical protein
MSSNGSIAFDQLSDFGRNAPRGILKTFGAVLRRGKGVPTVEIVENLHLET